MRKNKVKEEINNFPETYQREVWINFTPQERLRRSWRLRKKLRNLKRIHDKKIFPMP